MKSASVQPVIMEEFWRWKFIVATPLFSRFEDWIPKNTLTKTTFYLPGTNSKSDTFKPYNFLIARHNDLFMQIHHFCRITNELIISQLILFLCLALENVKHTPRKQRCFLPNCGIIGMLCPTRFSEILLRNLLAYVTCMSYVECKSKSFVILSMLNLCNLDIRYHYWVNN